MGLAKEGPASPTSVLSTNPSTQSGGGQSGWRRLLPGVTGGGEDALATTTIVRRAVGTAASALLPSGRCISCLPTADERSGMMY